MVVWDDILNTQALLLFSNWIFNKLNEQFTAQI